MLLKIVAALLALNIVNCNPDNETRLCPDFDSFDRPIRITSETCKDMSSYGFALPPVFNIYKSPQIDFTFEVGKINDSSTNDTCLLDFSLTINTCTVYVTQFKRGIPFYIDHKFLKAKREYDQLQLVAYDHGESEILLNSTGCTDDWNTQKYFSFILESNVTKNESNCIFTTIAEEFALLYDKKQHHKPVEVKPDGSLKSLIKMVECKEYCFLILMGHLIFLILSFGIFFYTLSKVLRRKRDSPSSDYPDKEKKQSKKEGNKKKRKESQKESMRQSKESQKTAKKESKKQSARQSKKSPKRSTAPTQTNNLTASPVSSSTVLESRF
ncbi:unnamed protein product [Bursaphelenchus xylophilus]|uniref:(pine wood nematode) hypothetical protein n=1 Tax=Bursaphelenchus xylophilus TaxID=6326 RepID=A0A1I7S603_BURXY|nr:unnamed protein product [Bursaphelenchus xylophilus]CAG9082438.1 unnamed protein product [Bursaphelenchus xylophilus]